MASIPSDGDDFVEEESNGQTDDWVVRVDVFDVSLSFRVMDGNAHLVSEDCNCDIDSAMCRHVAIAEGRVQGVFNDDSFAGVRGTIVEAPALWRPLVSDDGVTASDAPL